MGSETESASTMKLSLFSLPITKPREPPEMQSPPQNLASIPFQWEEAPGKPRPTAAVSPPQAKSRSLELPPRLVSESVKITSMSSPTTVLEGPYVRRSGFRTLSFSSPKIGSFRSPVPGNIPCEGSRCKKREISRMFSSSSFSRRWGSSKREDNIEGTFDFSSSSPSSVSGGFDDEVKISTVRRSKSLFSFSAAAASNLLQAIVRSISKRSP